MAIDTSALYMRPASLAGNQQFMGSGLGALFAALRQRDMDQREQDETLQRMSRQGVEDRLRQQQEARLLEGQRAEDAFRREQMGQQNAQFQARQRAEAGGAIADDMAKYGGKNIGLLAQAYGGKYEDVTATPEMRSDSPDFGNESMDMRPTPVPTGKKRISLPGADPYEFTPREAGPSHFAQLRAVYSQMPRNADTVSYLRLLDESEAAGLDNEKTIGQIEHYRQRRQSERNSMLAAGRAERAAARADQRGDDAAQRAAQQKLNALKVKAGNADRELAKMEEIITRNGAIPLAGKDADEFGASLKRAASSIGLVESGNPEAEISDKAKSDIAGRVATGRAGEVMNRIGGALGGPSSSERALGKLREERASLQSRINEHAKAFGLQSPAAPAGGGLDRLSNWESRRGR